MVTQKETLFVYMAHQVLEKLQLLNQLQSHSENNLLEYLLVG